MRFDIITIFPKVFEGYFNESIISRAQKNKLVKIKIWDLRKFLRGKERLDDRPYGGGPGMVLKVEPIARALEKIITPLIPLTLRGTRQNGAPLKVRGAGGVMVVFLSASGKQFDSKMAVDFSKQYNRIILIAGHYEGIDERIKNIVKACGLRLMTISVGQYVLTGGELPAMVIIDAITRHIPGVLGKAESLEEKRYGVGVPAYTRPEIFKFKGKKYKVPPVLLSGDHTKIDRWRKHHAKR